MSGQPIRILIAALGGEGGGVLAAWIVDATVSAGLWAQRTSIPGVAQRTGATTYYIEVAPSSGPRPVLALAPAPGEVDALVSSELLETVRQGQAGFVDPQRTLVIASTSRVLTIGEKQAMSDGRYSTESLTEAIRRLSHRVILQDFDALATSAGSRLNAVLLGAVAASDILPISADLYREAVRKEGKDVEGNLRGFETGFAVGKGERRAAQIGQADKRASPTKETPVPAEAADAFAEGVRRLTDYQDAGYAELYKRRILRFVGRAGATGPFIRELARHLALRMSVEDTVRVAQLKLSQARIDRLRREARAGANDIVRVTEFLKPGPEEILGALPSKIAEPLLKLARRSPFAKAGLPLRLRTTGPFGALQLAALASLRKWRLISWRYQRERAWVEDWLTLIDKTLAVDQQAAFEVVATAGLVKGYGETYERGLAAWRKIIERVVEPTLEGRLPLQGFADAVLQARIAAQADPEGKRLEAVVSSIADRRDATYGAAAE